MNKFLTALSDIVPQELKNLWSICNSFEKVLVVIVQILQLYFPFGIVMLFISKFFLFNLILITIGFALGQILKLSLYINRHKNGSSNLL